MTGTDIEHIELGDAINASFRCYYAHQYELSYRMCDQILAAHPEMADILYLRGLAALRLGRDDEGRSHIARAEQLAPQIRELSFLTAAERDGKGDTVATLERHLEEVQKFRATRNFILSYPKCGRTWVALVLGKYALGAEESDPLDLIGITSRQPGFSATEVSHDDVPRLSGAYRPLADKAVYHDKKVIFLVRDPRDVVVSHYFQHAKRSRLWDGGTFHGSMADFIRSDEGSVDNIVAFYNVWARERHKAGDFLLVRYEDLIADPQTHFKRMIDFFGWPDMGGPALAQAIEFGRFENMREIEARNTYNNPRLMPPADGNPDGFKTRRGKIGGYADYLDPADIDYLDRAIADRLNDLYSGYKR